MLNLRIIVANLSNQHFQTITINLYLTVSPLPRVLVPGNVCHDNTELCEFCTVSDKRFCNLPKNGAIYLFPNFCTQVVVIVLVCDKGYETYQVAFHMSTPKIIFHGFIIHSLSKKYYECLQSRSQTLVVPGLGMRLE